MVLVHLVIDELQQDYELRFTGEWDTTVVNGQTLITVREGTGSLATIFSTLTGAAGLATHPLNPNPGVADPFLIRVPFEVWNKDTQNIQVNLMFRDREQAATADPFFGWDLNNRMYAVIVNSAYNSTTPLTGTLRDPATWVLVFYGTNYTLRMMLLQYLTITQFKLVWIDTYSTQADHPSLMTWQKLRWIRLMYFQIHTMV